MDLLRFRKRIAISNVTEGLCLFAGARWIRTAGPPELARSGRILVFPRPPEQAKQIRSTPVSHLRNLSTHLLYLEKKQPLSNEVYPNGPYVG
jgi:hypothetical protein